MRWALRQYRYGFGEWTIVRQGEDSAGFEEVRRFAAVHGNYDVWTEDEENERESERVAERLEKAFNDGNKLASALLRVFAAVRPGDTAAIFELGYALAKASGYNDADGAMEFVRGFASGFRSTTPRHLTPPAGSPAGSSADQEE